MSQNPPKKKQILGLKHYVTNGQTWRYLVFFDIDRELETVDAGRIRYIMNQAESAYILYQTKHGHHLVGLTPIDSFDWGLAFASLHGHFKGTYYSGGTIRISRKKDEVQKLIEYSLHKYPAINNLFYMYAKRFPSMLDLKDVPVSLEWKTLFEVYGSRKE